MSPQSALVLHSLSIGDIASTALGLLRRAPGRLWALHAVTVVPTYLLVGAVLLSGRALVTRLLEGEDPFAPGLVPLWVVAGAGSLVVVVLLFAQAVSAVAVTRAGYEELRSRPWTVRSAYRAAWERFWPLMGAELLAAAVLLLGCLACVAPGVVWMGLMAMLVPVLTLESVGPVDALKRSVALFRAAPWHYVAVWLVYFALNGAITSPSGLVGELVSPGSGADPLALLDDFVRTSLVEVAEGVFVQPVVMAVFNLLWLVAYLHARARVEGFDLELEAERLGLPGAEVAP